MPSSAPTEAATRRILIDQALLRAGRNPADRTLVGQEIPVDGIAPQAWRELERQLRERRLPLDALSGNHPTYNVAGE